MPPRVPPPAPQLTKRASSAPELAGLFPSSTAPAVLFETVKNQAAFLWYQADQTNNRFTEIAATLAAVHEQLAEMAAELQSERLANADARLKFQRTKAVSDHWRAIWTIVGPLVIGAGAVLVECLVKAWIK